MDHVNIADGPDAERIRVDLGTRSYDVLIGRTILDEGIHADIRTGGTAMLVTNADVHRLHGERTTQMLARAFTRVLTVILPEGEAHKTWASADRIFDALLEAACDRTTTLVALGGGVIGDITGFAAACYMRGIAHIQVPTTLLAQVDSSVGGKTAINHALGKNMIGAFHQPSLVLCDTDTLDTLPEREFLAGLAEVVKYGAMADARFFDWLEGNATLLLERDPAVVLKAVRRSCEIKAAIVQQDEREAGVRATLNFGHTTAHAIETGVGYGVWLHGEAVACGMAVAASLSAERGRLKRGDADRLMRLIDRLGLPTRPPALGAEAYLGLMRRDKKSQGGSIRFVLLEGIGRASVSDVDEASVLRALDACELRAQAAQVQP